MKLLNTMLTALLALSMNSFGEFYMFSSWLTDIGQYEQRTPLLIDVGVNKCKDTSSFIQEYKKARSEGRNMEFGSYNLVNLGKTGNTISGSRYTSHSLNCTMNIFDSIPVGTYLHIDNQVMDMVTIYKNIDTVQLIKRDTIRIDSIQILTKIIHDTVKIQLPAINNTVTKHDTVTILKRDTLILKDTIKTIIRDTIFKIDTVNVFDTINTCSLTNQFYYETLNNSMYKGEATYGIQMWQSSDSMTWTSNHYSKDNSHFNKTVSVKFQTNVSTNVKVYIYDNMGTFVISGMFKTSNNNNEVKYLTWDGKAATGNKVTPGVYVMRVISEYDNHLSNNVYRVGIK